MNTNFLQNNPYKYLDSSVNPTLEEVENGVIEASRLLISKAIRNRGNEKPPFLSDEFTHLVGVTKILREDLGELGGILLRYSDGYVIKVNKRHPPTRQNFSCLHEIGHILLSELNIESCLSEKIEFRTRTFDPQKTERDRNKAREHLCDIVASELLMPENIFKTYLSSFDISINSLERLAHIFNTSVQATAIRIAETSTKPCITLLWNPPQNKNSHALRLAWYIGPGRKTSNRDRCFPLSELVTTSSVVYKTYESNQVIRGYKIFRTVSGNQRFPMESKGYGSGPTRFVISLVLPSV